MRKFVSINSRFEDQGKQDQINIVVLPIKHLCSINRVLWSVFPDRKLALSVGTQIISGAAHTPRTTFRIRARIAPPPAGSNLEMYMNV